MGDVLLAKGNIDDALKNYNDALNIYSQLTTRDKFRASWQRSLALTHQRIGKALQAKNDLQASLTQFKTCLGIPISEVAIDVQIETPRDLRADCQHRADQAAAALATK